jgi:hypothetical protein
MRLSLEQNDLVNHSMENESLGSCHFTIWYSYLAKFKKILPTRNLRGYDKYFKLSITVRVQSYYSQYLSYSSKLFDFFSHRLWNIMASKFDRLMKRFMPLWHTHYVLIKSRAICLLTYAFISRRIRNEIWDYPFKSRIRSKLRYVNPFFIFKIARHTFFLNEGTLFKRDQLKF